MYLALFLPLFPNTHRPYMGVYPMTLFPQHFNRNFGFIIIQCLHYDYVNDMFGLAIQYIRIIFYFSCFCFLSSSYLPGFLVLLVFSLALFSMNSCYIIFRLFPDFLIFLSIYSNITSSLFCNYLFLNSLTCSNLLVALLVCYTDSSRSLPLLSS